MILEWKLSMPSCQARILTSVARLRKCISRVTKNTDGPSETHALEIVGKMFGPLRGFLRTPVLVGTTKAEWITPINQETRGTIMYLHGGAYTSGSIDSHRFLAANIAIASNMRCLIVDYRLAPLCPFPAAVDDASDAYSWLLDNSVPASEITIAGDSAGGGLAIGLLVRLRDEGMPLPAATVCLSAWTDLTGSGTSWTKNSKRDVLLDAQGLLQAAQKYLNNANPQHPWASPIFADLRGVSPLMLQVGSEELLLDDSVRLAERARIAGVEVTLEIWDDMQHVWQFAAAVLPEGRLAIAHLADFIQGKVTRAASNTSTMPCKDGKHGESRVAHATRKPD
jgi:acetyl esterase/lipase